MNAVISIVVVSFAIGTVVGLIVALVAIQARRPLVMVPLTVVALAVPIAASYEKVFMLFFKSVFG